MLGKNSSLEDSVLAARLGPVLDRSIAAAGPALRQTLKHIGDQGPQAFDDAAVQTICEHLHPHLPLPVRMVVNKRKLADFLVGNRDLVLAAARKAGGA